MENALLSMGSNVLSRQRKQDAAKDVMCLLGGFAFAEQGALERRADA